MDGSPTSSRVAVEAGAQRLTRAELDSDSARLARRLAARGVGEGARVATTLAPGLEFARLLHATPRLGAVLVPLAPQLGATERSRLVEASGARLVVAEPLDGEEADVPLLEAPEPHRPHTLIFTSGTTAQPKPVLLTWANHRASAFTSAWRLGVAPDDRWLCCLPVHHVGGLAILLRSAIYGTTAVLHERFDADRVAACLGAGEVTLASLVPTMLARLRAAGLVAAPGLRALLLGGAPAPSELIDWAAAHALAVVQTYGMTETSSQIAATRTTPRPGAGARPLPGVELRVGEDGEILVKGPMVSELALDPEDGWLHTGDRGRVDHGLLYVEGRLAETIISGGENVSPAEVADALLAHPAVVEAAVAGQADPEWGEAVVAWVVISEPAREADLIAHCRERLAGFKVPKAIVAVEEIPRSPMGKPLLRADGSIPGPTI